MLAALVLLWVCLWFLLWGERVARARSSVNCTSEMVSWLLLSKGLIESLAGLVSDYSCLLAREEEKWRSSSLVAGAMYICFGIKL